jgi:hypothetical protein
MKNGLVMSAIIVALSACSGGSGSNGSLSSASSLNPSGIFKRKKDMVEVPLEFRDPRAFVPEITALSARPVKGGLMVLATGSVEMAGYHELELALTNDGFPDRDGKMLLEFRGFLPDPAPAVRNADTVEVAVFLSTSQLQYVRKIEVQAQSNSRSISR